jgi:Flp pilus assembly protein TadB
VTGADVLCENLVRRVLNLFARRTRRRTIAAADYWVMSARRIYALVGGLLIIAIGVLAWFKIAPVAGLVGVAVGFAFCWWALARLIGRRWRKKRGPKPPRPKMPI